MKTFRSLLAAIFSRLEKAALAACVMGFWGYAQHILLTEGLPKTVSEVLAGRMLGILDGILLLVVHHYFSSTSRSEMKDETARDLTALASGKMKDQP